MSTANYLTSLEGPVVRHRLSDEVRDRVASAIRAGDLAPGTRLVEAQLARTLGVSRSSIREALRLLERSGLAVADHGLYYVPELGIDDVRELVQLRIALERLAVALLVQDGPPADLSGLEEIAASMHVASASRRSAPVQMSELDAEFHKRLCEMPGHTRLARMRQPLADEIGLAMATTNLSFASEVGFAEAHDVIISALRTGQQAFCEHVIEEHILTGLRRYESSARPAMR